ncbi:uncharacterized protein si:ch211-171b20.3 isoform X2 [Pimephales promelas]|uniref:uncharacterized protein si:ch211-171b20.3 isoform X2 n=1 Tax=Pimephales promelas TaxID=90988 RepID=UPI0019557BF2|nr:uncharacterized protein si:ch211-171b20.3 isoform X2 [Pimephales promelas]KAG1953901.1 hypothetical protein F2P79_009363 [Pimephales promelas]
MKPNTSVVRPKLISLPTEYRLIIKDIPVQGHRCSSNYISSPPVSGCYKSAESRMNVFSAMEKCPCCPSYSRDREAHISITDGSRLPLLAKDRESNISGRHLLFDKRWRKGTYAANDMRDRVLINHNPTSPLSQEFHVYHSHNLNKFAHRKELSPRDPRPHVYGSDYLTSFPSVLLPATTPSTRLCLSQNYKNRPRVTNRVPNLFPVGANNKSQSYPDPHLGASASFVQRLTEISCLEAETVRHEKMKRLRKVTRQDS